MTLFLVVTGALLTARAVGRVAPWFLTIMARKIWARLIRSAWGQRRYNAVVERQQRAFQAEGWAQVAAALIASGQLCDGGRKLRTVAKINKHVERCEECQRRAELSGVIRHA